VYVILKCEILLGMQNQLTPGQNNLQQSGNNVQQNSSNLQQNGTPTTSSDVSTVLSQNAPTKGLRVQSAQTDPSHHSETYLPSTSPSIWIIPAALVVAVILAIVVWSRLRQEEPLAEEEAPIVETPKPKSAPKAKTSKKTTRRQRKAKR
jgi:hypothetical protein